MSIFGLDLRLDGEFNMEFGKNLLEIEVAKNESAQAMTGTLFALMYILIVAIGILIPVALATVASVNSSDPIVLLVLGFIPVFVALLPLAAVMGATRMFGA